MPWIDKAKQAEYVKRWRAANPDKVSGYYKKHAFNPAVKARKNARLRMDRRANPQRYLTYDRKKRGLPEPTRPEPMNCECCSSPKQGATLNLDHDHETGAFRGWLCRNCNLGLGLFKDDPTLMERAATYLREKLQGKA